MKWRTIGKIAAVRGVLAVVLIGAALVTAMAQSKFMDLQAPDPNALLAAFTCDVPGYRGVIADPNLNNLALAYRAPGSADLWIKVRVDLMQKFDVITRVFWLEHECAHHRLGHTRSTAPVSTACAAHEEDAADCAGIQAMVNAAPPMIYESGLNEIVADIRRIPDQPDANGIYKSSAARAAQVNRCARDDGWAQRVIAEGNCAP